MTKKVIKEAWIRTSPIMAGYVVLGLGFGLLLQKNGFGPLWALAMSILIYGGSMQYVGIGLMSGGASFLVTAITTLMVQARHLFYSISMIGRYKKTGKKKWYLFYSLSDETYALVSDDTICPEGENETVFRLLVSFFDQFYWCFGSFIGGLLGTYLNFDSTGMDFSMTALFITIYVQQWLDNKDHFPAIVGLVATALCRVFFGRDIFLIPSMTVILVLVMLRRNRLAKRSAEEETLPQVNEGGAL